MDVQEAVLKVLENEQNANYIVDLIEWTELEDKVIASQAIEGLGRVFSEWLRLHYEWCVPLTTTDNTIPISETNSTPLTIKFMAWVAEKYSATKQRLLELLHDDDLQLFALNSLMSFIEWEGRGYQMSVPGKTYHFPNTTFSKITDFMLTNDGVNLIEELEKYLEYDDIKYHLLQNINAFLCANHNRKNGDYAFIEKVYRLLNPISMAMTKTEPANFLCGDPVNNDSDLPQKVHGVSSLQKLRKVFSNCWLSFLRFKLSPPLHEEVLVMLHSNVMPHMVKPRLLVDFLTGSYDEGGVKAILALNGLFILMHQYHLDYPYFYQNLYVLLDSSVMSTCYLSRYFRLLNIFLSSTHLPLYLVASFVKKIARLCLNASPQAIMVGCVTVVNLIKRHPNCKVLLHRSTPEVLQVSNDPYDIEERDPAESGALESCLWELKVLQNHFHPAVSKLVSELIDPEKFSSTHHKLEDYLDITTAKLFKSEFKGHEGDMESVPINFIEPQGMWEDDEFITS